MHRRLIAAGGIAVAAIALVVGLVFTGIAGAAPRAGSAATGANASFTHACGAAADKFARCHAILRTNGTQQSTGITVSTAATCGSNPASGYTACDLQSAYAIGAASGHTTIAIVD